MTSNIRHHAHTHVIAIVHGTLLEAEADMFIAVLWLLQAIVLSDLVSASSYQEHLTLQPLPQSSLLAAFNFRTNISLSDFEKQNYNLFPRSLGQILLHTHTEELHLRFALGRWDAENWGERPRRGRTEGGTGVELWAWLQAPSTEVYAHL